MTKTTPKIETYDHARDMITELLGPGSDIDVDYVDDMSPPETTFGPSAIDIIEKHIRAAILADRERRGDEK